MNNPQHLVLPLDFLAEAPACHPEAAESNWTDAQALEAVDASLRQPAAVGRSVVWLMFSRARLSTFVLEIGPVTFFDADWCIPNALGPPWQEFQYRDELIRVIAHDPLRSTLDPSAAPRHEVLARVDLGTGHSIAWEERASANIRLVVGLIAARTGASSWRRTGISCLVMDGNVNSYSFRHREQASVPELDHYGMNGFADALESYKAELTNLLSRGSLPVDVAEALRLIGEAEQVDSRENLINGTATIAEQTVVVLQVAAVERLAAYAGMTSEAFASDLAAGWAHASYYNELARVVEKCISGSRNIRGPAFSQIISYSSGRRTLNLLAAFNFREELVSDCLGWFERGRARTLLESVGDAGAALRLLASFDAEAGVLEKRLRRCRNGLMHGNPVALESVYSVRDFSSFIVRTALDYSIRGLVENQPVFTEPLSVGR